MEIKYNYDSDNLKRLVSITIINDQVIATININHKVLGTNITIINKNKYNRKKIDTSLYINELLKILKGDNYYVLNENEYINLLDINRVKAIRLVGLKLEDKDIKALSKFNGDYHLDTKQCTFYKDCNLGRLKCDFSDTNSDLYSLDSLNGFSGPYLSLRKTHIVRMNKNILHLNSQVLELFRVKMNYELFFLMTDAKNLRRLNIHRCPHLNRLKNNDLLFISGFYNLEGITIDGVVDNYDQFDKLEKLRELKQVVLSKIDDKYKKDFYYLNALEEGLSDVRLSNLLCNIRLYNQNKYYNLRHKLYVPRPDRIKFEESIKNQSIEEIKSKLIEFYKLDYKTRKNYLRDTNKDFNFFDDIHGLVFDQIEEDTEDKPLIISGSGEKKLTYLPKFK